MDVTSPRGSSDCGHSGCRGGVCQRLYGAIVDARTGLNEVVIDRIQTTVKPSDRPVYPAPVRTSLLDGLATSVHMGFSRRGVLVDGEATTPVWECDECGLLVAEDGRTKHRSWHGRNIGA